MNTIKNILLLVLITLLGTFCSCSSSSTSSGLSGSFKGKNALGFEYTIEFISGSDCIVSDPRRGRGPATYKVVGSHVLLSMPGGGGADINMEGDTLSFSDGGYSVVLKKE